MWLVNKCGESRLKGKIVKIHSDFYYVKTDEHTIVECKIREKLKKEKTEIFVGDFVNVEEDSAAITKVFERKNSLPRPSIANIDQIAVVAALTQPELDFIQLNRYLCQAKLYNIPAIICINKSDLETKENIKELITEIYPPMGYKVIFTSALTGEGVDDLRQAFQYKLTVLSGMSGVGKTSLLNNIHPDLRLKTKETSQKTGKGTHTTRHVEILEIQGLQIADTPGFSYLRFDTLLPAEITNLFEEISKYAQECHFSDCLHLTEEGCNVLEHLDNIAPSRYESYKIFVQEAQEYKERLYNEGHKKENFYKSVDKGSNKTKQLVKIGTRARKKARNTERQKFSNISVDKDELY
jgi:ribosome biogenesis GTPase